MANWKTQGQISDLKKKLPNVIGKKRTNIVTKDTDVESIFGMH